MSARARPIARLHWCALAAAATFPLWRGGASATHASASWPDFPTTIEGRALRPSAPLELERAYLEAFPGRVGRFEDGERVWILRQVATPTLKLHSSARCLRAAGWSVETSDAEVDAHGRTWSRVHATRGGRELEVRERVESSTTGRSWPDIDTWRWDAWLGRDPGPWCAYSALEPR